MFLGWMVEVAKELGIYHSVFIAGVGYRAGHFFFFSICLNKSFWRADKEEFLLPNIPKAGKVHQPQLPIDLKYFDGSVSVSAFILPTFAILLNAIEGMGKNGVSYFQRKKRWKACLDNWTGLFFIAKKRDHTLTYGSCSEWHGLHQVQFWMHPLEHKPQSRVSK